MSKLPISQMIAEAEQWHRANQDAAAKPGKGQELARFRMERSGNILTILTWFRDDGDDYREFLKAKRHSE